MGDVNNLPAQEPASKVEPVSQPAQQVEPPKATEPVKPEAQAVPQPLTEERVAQLIAESTQRAVEQAKDLGRRELQAQQDRNRAEVARAERRAKQAETRLGAYDSNLANLDEDTRSAIEQTRLKGDNQYYQSIIQEEETRKQQEAYAGQLRQSLRDEATALGVDPNDNRVDYALDESDYFKGRQRFTGSLSKIIKSHQDALSKNLEAQTKDIEMRLRKELGLDSVPQSSGAGVDTSDETFTKRMSNPDYSPTAQDMERAEKILNRR